MNGMREQITFGLGFLGSVLGVLNIWRSIDRDRVKLRVTAKAAYPMNTTDDRPRLCLDIVNLSMFPVTVSEAGFSLWFSRGRVGLIKPILYDNKPWPRRLESREACSVYFSPELDLPCAVARLRRAYVKTDCGETRYGSIKRLRGFIAKTVAQLP